MLEKKPAAITFCFFLSLLLILSACVGLPLTTSSLTNSSGGGSGASLADAQAMAQAALDRMDGGGQSSSGLVPSTPQQPSQGSSTAQQQQGTVSTSTGARPAWVDDVYSVYSSTQYVSARGQGSDRASAERDALVRLASYFGQSIYADQTVIDTYSQAVKSGAIDSYTSSTSVQDTIRTSVSMDTLVGAEIRGVWFDSRSTYYAVAVLEKARAAQVYTDLITANQSMINNLTTMSQSEKNSLDGYSRYQFSAAVADINTTYGNLLRMIDAPLPEGMVSGNQYRLEAQNIIRAIPIGITIKNNNDRAGRIQNAFARAISDLGFRSGGTNSRYVLVVDMTVSQPEFPNSPYIWARIELYANLTDTINGQTLLSYGFGPNHLREGTFSFSESESRVFSAAERKINSEYAGFLREYLSQLLPVK